MVAAVSRPEGSGLKKLHSVNHMGVDKIMFLGRKVGLDITMESVQKVVRCSDRCQSIDSASSVHESESIQAGGD